MGTSVQCYDTFITWADTSLISASVLLLVLRHICYVGRHVLFSIVPYLRVLIVLRPSHSLLPVYVDIYLYVVHPNNMTYANIYMIRI